MKRFKSLPKYSELDDCMPEINENEVNIVIDFKSFLSQYYSNNYNYLGTKSYDVKMIITKTMSIISYYRNYFYKNNQKRTYFYFLYSSGVCQKIVDFHYNYKQKIYEKIQRTNRYAMSCINESINILKDLINYTPGCLFIDTSDYDEHSYIKHIITQNKPTMIITKYANEMKPLLDSHVFILETYNNGCFCTFHDDYSKLLPLFTGSQEYGFKSSKAGVERANVWLDFLRAGELIKLNTLENPIDYEQMNKIKNQVGIHKTLLKYKEQHDLIFNILSGNFNYYSYKNMINDKITDEHPKYDYQQFLEVNESFADNPINISCLMRGF